MLCIPEFKFNLNYVSKLALHKHFEVHFDSHHCLIQDPLKRVMGIGKLQGNFYKLVLPTSIRQASQYSNSTQFFNVSIQTSVNTRNVSQLWHDRLGHSPIHVIKTVDCLSKQISGKMEMPCDVCHYAKQSRLPFSVNESRASKCFDLIHCDLWEPYKRSTYHTCHSFLTIVDDYSRCTLTYLLSSKSQVCTILQKNFKYVQNQFQTTVKTVRTDNRTEFFNTHVNSLFNTLGIVHQHSFVYTPQQNGRVERKYRHLLSVARALRFKASLPIHLWSDCLLTATYLINRTPSSLLQNKTPFELLYNKLPEYSHLKVLGCLCFSSTLSKRQDKFFPRAYKCIFLGYPHNQKGYRLLHLDSNTIFISREVIFYENIFPFALNKLLLR